MRNTGSADRAAVTTLILASASPRRQELIALLGLPFSIVPSRYEEPAPPTSPVDIPAFVTTLALNKGVEVAQRRQAELMQGAFVIAADTLVTIADADIGVPLGKPSDADDALRMLRQLSGRTHRVYTGIAVIASINALRSKASGSDEEQTERDKGLRGHMPFSSDVSPETILPPGLVLKTAAVCTRVRFRAMSDDMIANYVATGEPMDKAGSYGAQGCAAPFIESFEGDFFNVVGLPLCRLGQLLESMGVVWGISQV